MTNKKFLVRKAIIALAVAGIGAGTSFSVNAWMARPEDAIKAISRYEPEGGRVLVVAGQNLAATRAYYQLAESDTVPRPAGFTDYISYQIGNHYPAFAPDYPTSYRGNDGLRQATNWGSGEQCADCLLRPTATSEAIGEAIIAIGMYIGGPLGEHGEQGDVCSGKPDCNAARITRGEMDGLLEDFADWLNGLGERPVFLRIGYEFDGPWNGYEPQQYKQAFRYIRRFLERRGVDNVAYVMQSYGYASYETMQRYFPAADETGPYVDWVGYSYFTNTNEKVGAAERQFARDHNLKVFIAEVTPHTGDCSRQIDVTRDENQAKAWIETFDAHVREHRDVVRAIAYINARWNDRTYSPMWSQQQDHNCPGYFANSNARLNDNMTVAKFWGEKMSDPMYLNGEPGLYSKLLTPPHSPAKKP